MEDSAAPVQVGDHLVGKYVVERVLGQGGMGVVVQAAHVSLGSKVAIKFLLPDACAHPGAVERFLREARAAVQIQSEHVARVSDVGTLETGLPYMVMEFLDGNDLAEEIQSRQVLPTEEAVGILLQALEALAEAHAVGIVHRDLKPANLFLAKRRDGTRTVKVLDFGISKAVQPGEANLTQTSSMMGSPLYMAPEQIRNAKSVDARADIWSLGVILHECLSGRPPFGGETLSGVLAAIVADAPESLATLRSDLPPMLVGVVHRCLEKDPARRVQNAVELAQALAVFAPTQAQRSIPRIAAVLGKTHPHGTREEGVFAASSLGGSSPDVVGASGGAERAPGASTAQTWTQTDGGAGMARRSPLLLVASAVGLVGLTAGIAWNAARSGPSSPVATSVPEASSLPTALTRAPEAPLPSAPSSVGSADSPGSVGSAASVELPAPTKVEPDTAATAPARASGGATSGTPKAQTVARPSAPRAPSAAVAPTAKKAPVAEPAPAEDPLAGRR